MLFIRNQGFNLEHMRTPRDRRLPKGVYERVTTKGERVFVKYDAEQGKYKRVNVDFHEYACECGPCSEPADDAEEAAAAEEAEQAEEAEDAEDASE